jgi:hypothetical protein
VIGVPFLVNLGAETLCVARLRWAWRVYLLWRRIGSIYERGFRSASLVSQIVCRTRRINDCVPEFPMSGLAGVVAPILPR